MLATKNKNEQAKKDLLRIQSQLTSEEKQRGEAIFHDYLKSVQSE